MRSRPMTTKYVRLATMKVVNTTTAARMAYLTPH
jgi:hypothetical protein